METHQLRKGGRHQANIAYSNQLNKRNLPRTFTTYSPIDVLLANANSNVNVVQLRKIPVSQGEQFHIEGEYRTHNLVGSGSQTLGVRTYDLKGEPLGWVVAFTTQTKTHTFTKVGGTYTVGSGVGYISPRVTFGGKWRPC